MEHKISVLMPVYNGLPLIKASIASLMRQTYQNWECIIVDDGSSDGTPAFLDSLNDSRFIVFHFDENKGRPVARQKTLDMCSGEFVSFLDAGDLYSPKCLETLLRFILENPDVSLVSSAMCSFGTSTQLTRKRGVSSEEKIIFTGKKFPNFASSLLITERSKSFQFNPSMKLGEDRDYLEHYLFGQIYMEIPEILYYYSEFDSVNKAKIRDSYANEIKKSIRQLRVKPLIKNLLKWLYSIIVFPFISIDSIIQRRGVELSAKELSLFNIDCNTIIQMVLRG